MHWLVGTCVGTLVGPAHVLAASGHGERFGVTVGGMGVGVFDGIGVGVLVGPFGVGVGVDVDAGVGVFVRIVVGVADGTTVGNPGGPPPGGVGSFSPPPIDPAKTIPGLWVRNNPQHPTSVKNRKNVIAFL